MSVSVMMEHNFFFLVVEKKKHKMVAAEYSYSLYFIYIYIKNSKGAQMGGRIFDCQ